MATKKSRLGNHQSSLQKWQLKENPFRPTPPEDPEVLAKIFYGRDQELDNAIPALYEGRNVLIRGAWGIGKTSLILNLIYQLQQEVVELDEKMLVLYLSSIPGEKPVDFYRALLMAIADSLKEDPEAQDIARTLLGYSIQRTKTSTEGKVSLGIFSFSLKDETPSNLITPIANSDPYPLLIRQLEKAEQYYNRIVFAIDDFDKKDPIVVQTILEGSLDLFRNSKNRAFIITGRGFTDLQEATLKALGIFSEDINLPIMHPDDLRHIVINYLNSARLSHRDDCYPFTEEAIALITDYAQGFPRQLNTICEKVLRQAASKGYDEINLEAFTDIWQIVQQDYTHSLTPQLLNLLYIAHQAGGISEDIKDEDLAKLDAPTFVSLLPTLKSMEDRGVLIRREDEGGMRFLPSKLFQPPT
ncbi:AAA+ family ATPase [Pseudanabaena sp. SR411]|uniref:P-loop NTPase fold protein n=1 Tax=Pseudanabaena sp. SR411 TaxID=1980935 RepID=UPI000B988C3F|nr:P-loop NTPase fold protein [Pseudanabaena sp. SR411]OYQ62367.1 AAA+ family ATPase [Pseudanabaena sp. SR411]